jgi:arylsulfatase A-like enzyme
MREDSKESSRDTAGDEEVDLSSSTGNSIFATNMRQGCWFVLFLSISGWLVDLCALALDEGAGRVYSHPRGVLASLFLAGVFGLFAGAVTGFSWASVLGRRRGNEWLQLQKERLRNHLWEGDTRAHMDRVVGAKALILSLLVFAYLSYRLSLYFILAYAQPHFIAIAVVALHVGLILLCVPIFHILKGVVGLIADRVNGRFPVLNLRFGRWLVHLVLVSFLVSLLIGYKYWSVLSFLPWGFFIQLAFMLALGISLATWFYGQRSKGITYRWLLALASVLWGLGAFVGFGLSHGAQKDRAIFEDHVFFAQHGRAFIGWFTDLDGDGFYPFFGGGDCAAMDVAVHPGAVDVPENGVDEDCFGGDLTMDILSGTVSGTRHRVPEAFPSRPNIVFITIDAFSAKHLESLGYEKGITPHLDQLAKEGVLFENCFSQGPSTRLSFPAIFTSRWDTEIGRKLIGKHPYPLLADNEMMAEILRKSGYSTHAVIPAKYFSKKKWKGLHQGFEKVHEGPARFWNKRNRPHNAHRVTDAAIKVLQKKRKKPLFLWAHYYDAHTPHRWPQGIEHRGKSKEWIYNGELEFVDRHVGRLLKQIEEHLGENTLIIVTSDHGHGFDKPRHRKHGYGYDLNTVTLHVPLIVHGAGLKPRRVPSLVSTLDILPTLTNLIGVGAKLETRGSSLVPELYGQVGTRPQLLFHQYFLQERRWKDESPLQMVSIRTPRYNLMLDRKKGRTFLWDWQKDYLERKNLMDSDVPEIRAEELKLRQLLSAFLFQTGGLERGSDQDAAVKEREAEEASEPAVEPEGSRPKVRIPAMTPAFPSPQIGPPLPPVLRAIEPPVKPRRAPKDDR